MTKRLLVLVLALGATSLHGSLDNRYYLVYKFSHEFVYRDALYQQLSNAVKSQKFDINRPNKAGKTPLAIACEAGLWPNIFVLLEFGADPTLRGDVMHKDLVTQLTRFFDFYIEEMMEVASRHNTQLRRYEAINDAFERAWKLELSKL